MALVHEPRRKRGFQPTREKAFRIVQKRSDGRSCFWRAVCGVCGHSRPICPGEAISDTRGNELRVPPRARNAFNHPVFVTPNTSVDDPNFGTVTYTSVGPREVQLGFKFNF